MSDPYERDPVGFFQRIRQDITDLERRLVGVLPRWLTASRVQMDIGNLLQAPYMQFGTDSETGFQGTASVSIYTAEASPTGGRVYQLSQRDHLGTYRTTARPGDTFEVSVTAKRIAGSANFNPYVGQFTTDGNSPPTNPFYDIHILQPTTATQDLGNGWWRYRARLRLNADPKITRVGAWFQIVQSIGGPTRWLISDPEIRRVDDDTGWITPSLLNDFTNNPGSVAYRRLNGVVFLKGELLRTTAPTSSTTAFQLPSGFRPAARQRVVNWGSSGDPTQATFLTVLASGNVDVLCTVARTATPGYHIATSFIADN